MKFVTTLKTTQVDKAFRDIKQSLAVKDKTMTKLAILVQSSIKKRVIKKGESLKGRTMKYRSSEYKQYRASKGRKTSYKNLLMSGRMWRALSSEIKKTGNTVTAKLFFGSPEANDKAMGNDKREAFFGIGPNEEKIIDRAEQEILKGLF